MHGTLYRHKRYCYLRVRAAVWAKPTFGRGLGLRDGFLNGGAVGLVHVHQHKTAHLLHTLAQGVQVRPQILSQQTG